jgi:pyrroloquinoline-quinone synthase
MNDRIAEIDAIVAQFDINNHPFYQEWAAGTLPNAKLQDYAGEYGRFIGTIARGWETIGEPAIAEEERDHEVLWGDFRYELGLKAESRRAQTDVLVNAATKYFGEPAEALGALYAFEAQQPKTSEAKLAGLTTHYKEITDKGREYFRIHAADFAEPEMLRAKMAAMSDSDFARTKSACTVVCAAMWSALDGVYYAD